MPWNIVLMSLSCGLGASPGAGLKLLRTSCGANAVREAWHRMSTQILCSIRQVGRKRGALVAGSGRPRERVGGRRTCSWPSSGPCRRGSGGE